ncbi:MAG: hypothetical protein ACK50J_18025 [Planctomyces sp.]
MFGIRVSYVALGLALILSASAANVEAGKGRRHHSMRREPAHCGGHGHHGAAGHSCRANGCSGGHSADHHNGGHHNGGHYNGGHHSGGHYASFQSECCGGSEWQHHAYVSPPSADCQMMDRCCGVPSGTMMAAPTHNAVHPQQESVTPQNAPAPGT